MTTSGPHDPNNPYEPMPAAPPVDPREHAAVPAAARPRTVTAAFWCWIAVSAVLVLSLIGGLSIDRAEVEKALREANTGLSAAELDQAASLFVTLAIALPLVFLVVFLGSAFPMRAGRNWARIVLAIFGGLLLLLTLLGTAGASAPIAIALVALIGAAIVLMFVGQSNPYFATRKTGY
ncbi:hypothetical protein ACFQV2_36275 [Actinokineospora soli]|uniref:Integral membrane protein n=1 Tax=Actinokineospora soli TaxID=1048753 RepID=A0ABW2TZ99_9PSEU